MLKEKFLKYKEYLNPMKLSKKTDNLISENILSTQIDFITIEEKENAENKSPQSTGSKVIENIFSLRHNFMVIGLTGTTLLANYKERITNLVINPAND